MEITGSVREKRPHGKTDARIRAPLPPLGLRGGDLKGQLKREATEKRHLCLDAVSNHAPTYGSHTPFAAATPRPQQPRPLPQQPCGLAALALPVSGKTWSYRQQEKAGGDL